MTKFKCYFNILNETYNITDEYGYVWGIGTTIDEAIENAEFWLQTTKITELEMEE